MIIRLLSVFSICLLAAFPAKATEPGVFSAQKAYAYATTSVQKNGAVFLELKNHDNRPARLIGARDYDENTGGTVESDVAERIELHTHIMDGDMMMMREVEGYDIPASGTLTLEPSGHHIMLMGLKKPLKAGDTFGLLLTFEEPHHHYPLDVVVEIKNPGDVE